jgi:hypothetical protein
VIGKELRLYSRSVLRSVLLMISFLVGVLAAVIPALSGKTSGLPFGGLLFTVISAACFTNFYGDDGTSLWLTLVTPGAARADVRGRAWAWFLVTGPAGFLLTVVLTAASATHDLALRCLAVPVGLAWAAFLGWRSVQLAQQRLENYGPEIFARVRAPIG